MFFILSVAFCQAAKRLESSIAEGVTMKAHHFFTALALACVTATGALGESTIEQLTEQGTGNFAPGDSASDTLNEGRFGKLAEILRPYAYIDPHFRLMDGFGNEDKLRQSLSELRENPRTTNDLIALYKTLTKAASEETGYFGEARWRTLYLLGELHQQDAAGLFMDIAMQPMPSGKWMDEVGYKAEYRLRARAVAGLEQLRDVERLKRLYAHGGMLSGLAAASLVELGSPPDGVHKIDGRKVFGLGDPKDYNPRRGEVPDKLPEGMTAAPRHGVDDDDLPAITPRFDTDR